MEELTARRGDPPVFLGVDTHSEAHVAVALDGAGRYLGMLTIPNSATEYAELLGWAFGYGALVAAGVEGTGSYGVGLSRFLRARNLRVGEVNRTSRQHHRRYGKHDAAGSRVVEQLHAEGRDVRAFVRNASRAELLPDGIDIAIGDLDDADSVAAALLNLRGFVAGRRRARILPLLRAPSTRCSPRTAGTRATNGPAPGHRPITAVESPRA